jgi:hypothetical protein
MTRFAPLLLTLFLALASAAATSWTCTTPDKDFQVTLPFSAAHDVSTYSADGVKRTGFFIDSVMDKELFAGAGCLNVREFGVWSEPYRDETSFKKFVLFKFGDPGRPGERGAARETAVRFGSFTGFQLDRDYVGYKGVRTLERVVGVHTPSWQHSFYCMWHKNPKEPAVKAFFESIKCTL